MAERAMRRPVLPEPADTGDHCLCGCCCSRRSGWCCCIPYEKFAGESWGLGSLSPSDVSASHVAPATFLLYYRLAVLVYSLVVLGISVGTEFDGGLWFLRFSTVSLMCLCLYFGMVVKTGITHLRSAPLQSTAAHFCTWIVFEVTLACSFSLPLLYWPASLTGVIEPPSNLLGWLVAAQVNGLAAGVMFVDFSLSRLELEARHSVFVLGFTLFYVFVCWILSAFDPRFWAYPVMAFDNGVNSFIVHFVIIFVPVLVFLICTCVLTSLRAYLTHNTATSIVLSTLPSQNGVATPIVKKKKKKGRKGKVGDLERSSQAWSSQTSLGLTRRTRERLQLLPLNFVFIGLPRSGKTQIINQFASYRFTFDYIPTHGCEFQTRDLVMDEHNCIANVKMYDAGPDIAAVFFSKADACVIVYDVSSETSRPAALRAFYNRFMEARGFDAANVPVFFVGNKVDMLDELLSNTSVVSGIESIQSARQPRIKEYVDLASELGVPNRLVSAFTFEGLEDTMMEVVQAAIVAKKESGFTAAAERSLQYSMVGSPISTTAPWRLTASSPSLPSLASQVHRTPEIGSGVMTASERDKYRTLDTLGAPVATLEGVDSSSSEYSSSSSGPYDPSKHPEHRSRHFLSGLPPLPAAVFSSGGSGGGAGGAGGVVGSPDPTVKDGELSAASSATRLQLGSTNRSGASEGSFDDTARLDEADGSPLRRIVAGPAVAAIETSSQNTKKKKVNFEGGSPLALKGTLVDDHSTGGIGGRGSLARITRMEPTRPGGMYRSSHLSGAGGAGAGAGAGVGAGPGGDRPQGTLDGRASSSSSLTDSMSSLPSRFERKITPPKSGSGAPPARLPPLSRGNADPSDMSSTESSSL